MNIKIISIANKLNPWESESINFYIKQLPHNFNVEFINLKGQQNPKISKDEALKKESELILSKISKNDYLVSWDQNGDQLNSEDFSRFILNCQQNDTKIIFIIGGSFGLSDVIKNRSNKIFSASLLTFPHRLFRLILMEQIYRAHSIITNMPYHK